MTEQSWLQIKNPLAERLRRGELGLVLQVKQVHTPNIAVVAKTCGFDAIYIDMQHTAVSIAAAADISMAALANGVCPLVRIAGSNFADALRLLDGGAFGIVIPEVEDAEKAQAAVDYLRFAPLGRRSTAGSWPHFGYRSVPAADAARILNAQTLLIAMVESQEGLSNIEEIAAVDGIDVIHMGTNDMAADLGLAGDLANPALQQVFQTIVSACRKHGKIAGIGGLSGNPQLVESYVRLGAQFMTGANEWSLLIGAAQERARFLRGFQSTSGKR